MAEMGATDADVRGVAARARDAAAELATLPRAAKDAGLHDGLSARLSLDPKRVLAMADGLRDVAALPDPVGEVVRGYTQPNGLEIRQLRVPFGVLAMIYEARPNVTVDAAGLALKSGNAALLRGSASAYSSNLALVDVLATAAERAGFVVTPVQCVA